MPELPEVETTLRGIKPYLKGEKIIDVVVRKHQLRWPIPARIKEYLLNQIILDFERRGKYLFIRTTNGSIIIHLGMSGTLRVLSQHLPPNKHDHIDIIFSNHMLLRFTDPRRFGAFLWIADEPSLHPLIKNLGVEPLSKEFSGTYLYEQAKNRSIAVKSFIMNSKIVTGIGNIYAAESLFAAGIHPDKKAKLIAKKQYDVLANSIKIILKHAIKKGGTTLKDFLHSKGQPGYFSTELKVYGREGLPCFNCSTRLKSMKINQRSTVFCKKCQKNAKDK